MTMLATIVIAALAAEPSSPLEAFEQAWVKGDVKSALGKVSDNATFVFVMDPSDILNKKVPDQTFNGKDEISGLLWSFLPGLSLTPGERTTDKALTRYPAKLSYPWLKRLGVAEANAQVEARVGTDGRINWLKLALSPEDAAIAAPQLAEQNKAVVRHFLDEVNKKNFSVVDEVLLPSFVQHSVVAVSPGRQGVADLYVALKSAFPDFHFDVDDMVAEGNRVAVRMTGRYTHKGEYMGVAPTGKAVVLLKMDFFAFVNGKCTEHWDSADRYGLLQQLGVVPKISRFNELPGYDGFR
jgi:predicted ester cyclase